MTNKKKSNKTNYDINSFLPNNDSGPISHPRIPYKIIDFKEYFTQTINQIIPALDVFTNPLDMTMDGKQLLIFDFLIIGCHFGVIDHELSNEAANFINDILEVAYVISGDVQDVTQDEAKAGIADALRSETIIWERIQQTGKEIEIGENITSLSLLSIDELNNDNRVALAGLIYRFAKRVVEADTKVTPGQRASLEALKIGLFDIYADRIILDYQEQKPDNSKDNEVKKTNVKEKLPQARKIITSDTSLDNLVKELNSLVGLQSVKQDVAQLINFLKIQQLRQSKGMKTEPISRHLVFYGNPGSGKTTVARLISKIYKSLGILSNGHIVETDRSGMVAGYVGQTALKVNELVKKAIGGILFIDEAYSLSSGGENDFGREAIDTLLKLMEDNREDLIVIVAGYTEKMDAFLSSNPGLRSRFNKFLNFQDYDPEELTQIFENFCSKNGYEITFETRTKLLGLFSEIYTTRDNTFANGRLVRNIYEKTINNQANRIVSIPDISEQNLICIDVVDLPSASDLNTI